MKPDFAGRQKKLAELIEKRNVDAVITSDVNDVLYYTGYAGLKDDKVLMICTAGGRPKLLVSSLENDATLKYTNIAYVRDMDDLLAQMRRFGTLGFDERSLSLALFSGIKKKLKAKMVPAGKMMEIPRIRKDEYEIEQMRQAIKITGKALSKVSCFMWGNSEKRIADAVEIEYRKRGVSESFDTIVCAGAQAAFVHHRPGQSPAKAGMPILIDTGCRVNGYCSDITRMFFGRLGPKQRKIYESVRQIHDELIDKAGVGVTYKELEELQKRLFAKKGYKVMHGLGHGLGLSVHESCGETLAENAVMTIEPGIYIKGFGGFRIEDVILIKKNGTEILSKGIPIL